MKVVINVCFGGFSISLAATKHMAAAGSVGAKADVAAYEEELTAFAHFMAHGKLPDGSESRFHESSFAIDAKYGSTPSFYGGYDYRRDDPLLVAAVEALGEDANGEHSELSVVEIPDGTDYTIEEYDGNEHIAETHRTWR